METVNVNSDDSISNISYSTGATLSINGGATLTMDESAGSFARIYFNNALRTLKLSNSSTTDIYILTMSGEITGNTGNLELDTRSVTLSSPYTVPADSNGDRPEHIGFFVADGETYTEVDSLSGMYADERGLHFTYNSSTGVITVGDNTNGKTPSGDIEIPNFYIDMNGNALNLSSRGKLKGSGWLTIIDPSVNSGHHIDLGSDSKWSIVNPTNSFDSSNLVKHSYAEFNFVQTGTGIRFVKLGENTSTDHIVFSIVATPTYGGIVQNYNRPLYGKVECRYTTQPSSAQTYAFTALNQNGGDAEVIVLGGNANVLELEGGVGGELDVKYSAGYKRTDNAFVYGIHSQNAPDVKVKTFTRIGSEAWPSQCTHFLRIDSGNVEIGKSDVDITFPSDATFDDFLYVNGDSTGKINRVTNNGSSASDSRDYNVFAHRGWKVSNVKMPNDTSHGCQISDNTEYHFCTMIGQTPSFGTGMNHSTIISNAAGDEGAVWLMPYTATTGIVTVSNGRSYYEPNAVTTNQSGLIEGVGIATAATVNGFNVWRFTVEYKIWELGESEPASYTSFTLANIQASQSGFTTSTKWYIKYRVTKNADATDQAYITGIEIECPFSTTFVWDEGSVTTVTAPDVISGSGVQLCNVDTDTILDYQKLTSAGYSVDLLSGVSVGDTLRLRVAYQSAGSHKEPVEVLGVVTAGGLEFVVSQQDWAVPNTWGTDGSTVTKFIADGTNIDVDIVGSSEGTKTELAAWWADHITTEDGIEDFWNAYTLESVNSIRQNTSYVDVVIENTQPGSFRFTDNDVRYYREDNSLPYDDTGSAIFMDYSGVPLVVEAETTFTEDDRSKLNSIPSFIPQVVIDN